MARILRRTLILVSIIGLCALIAFHTAYWWAFGGYFECIEGGCGILAEFVLWPIITIINMLIVGAIFWFVLLRSRKSTSESHNSYRPS